MPKKKDTGLSKIAKAIAKPDLISEHLNDQHKINVDGCSICDDRKLEDSPQSITESQLGVVDAPLPDFDLHDVVQVLDKASKKYAQLAIIHTINGVNAVCYQPRYREKPESFIIKLADLHRVGKAHLKFKAALA